MPEIKIRKLDNPTEKDINNAAKVLATAFAEDLFTLAVCGGDASKIYDFDRATVAAAALAGELWVANYGEHDFVSVATWLHPGHALLDSPDHGEAGFNKLFGSFAPELAQWWMTDFLPHYSRVNIKALGDGTKTANWNLQLIGTLPEFRRHGLATALINVVLEKAKAESKMITLEAEIKRNLDF